MMTVRVFLIGLRMSAFVPVTKQAQNEEK